MQMVATDILGPLPESLSGNSYILVGYRLYYPMGRGIPNSMPRSCSGCKEVSGDTQSISRGSAYQSKGENNATARMTEGAL